MNQTWIPTLLLIAALCLLPGWIVGGAALGAAAGLWAAARWQQRRTKAAALKRERERTERQIEKGLRPLTFEEVDELLYRHEQPYYAYCAGGAGGDPREDSAWVLKREVLRREWTRLCPHKERVVEFPGKRA